MSSDEMERQLIAAARRNGRDCADAAFLVQPPPWSDQEAERMMTCMADALMKSFPGGPGAFMQHMEVICEHARAAFDERIAELRRTDAVESGRPC